ncbi:FAD-binding oxidoreductase [Brevundimonas sp.]|uniref:FAD-binding oxidoreductase n=1 Tax=Brevundimonas sp. TaxID=1871086 RepID=UPI002ABC2A2C|nr:FAD-binding oxidoreductase [Brevundimonas sp.]MDZ4364340.1 FAD-binding oxidoreductase [Brevundimonas sp.]
MSDRTVAPSDVRSWGRVERGPFDVIKPQSPADLAGMVQSERPHLAMGALRSYGDTPLSRQGAMLDMTGLNRLRAFDPDTGILTADAGVTLSDIMKVFAPRGWFVPVTPGTRYVTLGGAVANDIHGKNHHVAGTFGRHVTGLRLLRSDGAYDVTPDQPLFAATVGGLGLTGVIETVSLRLERVGSSYLSTETLTLSCLDHFYDCSAESEAFEHTVAWLDCTARGASMGRGVFTRSNWLQDGRFQAHDDPRRTVPFDAPGFVMNPITLKALNVAYRIKEACRPRTAVQHYSEVFHPLDAIAGWNRMYGPDGFYQYQCVIPLEAGREPLRRLLAIVSESGEGSTLAVLKLFGDVPSPGMLSFPRPGYTLALDFPNRGARTMTLMAQLDEVVAQAGGRLYPAKDGRMERGLFEAGYPGLSQFRDWRDPACQSEFSRRMGL